MSQSACTVVYFLTHGLASRSGIARVCSLFIYFCCSFVDIIWAGNKEGCAAAKWLRHCATNRQVAGSIPEGVIGIFQWHKPSGRSMALGSTQPLKEMSTRCISWGEGSRCVRLTLLPPSCAVVMKSGNLNFLEPPGPLQACNGTALPLPGNKEFWSLKTSQSEAKVTARYMWYSK